MGIAETREKYVAFPKRVNSLMLSTVDGAGFPHASYAPFLCNDEREFFMLVSELSQHARNLQSAPKAAIMLIEDEQDAAEIFARDRLMYDCKVDFITKEDTRYGLLIQDFRVKFGELIDMLSQLSDFKLVKLTPFSGRFVVGFGAAFEIDIDNNHSLKLSKG